jgi:hypothetical protein
MICRNRFLVCLTGAGLLLGCALTATPSARADEIPEKYRESVKKGLEFLKRAQFKDGHWGANGDMYPISMTGLAGLALLMEGSTVREGKYSGEVKKAVDFLMGFSQRGARRDGLIFNENASETGRYMYGHGFATLFLACVYGDEDDRDRRDKLKDILTRAVKYIGNAQSSRGGFYYQSKMEGGDMDEGSVTITQLQALRACRNAGIPVPKDVINKSVKYLEDSTNGQGGVIYSLAHEGGRRPGDRPMGQGKPALTAAAIACVFSAGDYKNKFVQEWFKFCRTSRIDAGGGPGRIGHDEYTQYYFAQGLYALGDDGWDKMFPGSTAGERMSWSAYRTALFDHLVRIQNSDGSFPSGGGLGAGPGVYSTAVYCTVMQLDRGVVPFYQRAIGKSD